MALIRERLILLETYQPQRRDLYSRLERRVAGEAGLARKVARARYRRRERSLYHRRQVSNSDGSPRKILERPKRYAGRQLRSR